MTPQPTQPTLESRIDLALGAEGQVLSQLHEAFSNALGIYVFGSRAQGLAQPDSDLDLAILVEGYAAPAKLWEVSSALAEVVGCEVDLLDLRAASTVMQHQVLLKGRRLWAADPAAGLFESFVYSQKLELDQARAGLLSDVVREGTVYAR